MTDSQFFDLNDILATEERVNTEFKLDCFNLAQLDFLVLNLDPENELVENLEGEDQDDDQEILRNG